MKCLVCGKEFNPEKTGQKCPVCGFQAFNIIGQSEAAVKNIMLVAENYRKEFIGTLEMSIVAYEWKANEEEILVLAKKHYIPFPSLQNMNMEGINWIDEDFARLEDKQVDLILSVKNKNTTTKEIKVPVKIPEGEDFWRVGLSIQDGFMARLHLKTSQSMTSSNDIRIL